MKSKQRSLISLLASVALVLSSLLSVSAQAAMVSSQAAIAEHAAEYDRAQLLEAINEQGVKAQLQAMGVDADQVEQRVASLTPAELEQLNQEIQSLPAGQGVVGVLLTVFVVFVITDMLCATNIFSFINCINR